MKNQTIAKGLQLLFSATLIAMLALSIIPTQTARAQETSSDLTVRVVSAPKHVRDCEVFEVTFAVTNLGPDPVSGVGIGINIPDAFNEIELPEPLGSLAVGETATFTAVVQVTSFDKKSEPRLAWVLTRVRTFPDFRIDPNLENNSAEASIRIIGRDKSCF